jgi:CRISPR-associated helicase Cas3
LISIAQRTVKQIDGFRPFQRATIDALNSKEQIIVVEAPVGAGKSHIIRQAVDQWSGAVVLTYPTKVLMDAQSKALKNDFPNSVLWPYETGIPLKQSPTIFYYSSDTLITFLKKQGKGYRLDRSELIDTILHQQFWASKKNILLTSPDVLHLLVNLTAYRGSKRLLSFLTGAVVMFDEFHLYSGLNHFSKLLDNLLNSGVKKVILLSATPVFSEEVEALIEKYETLRIDFSESIGNNKDRIFNYPLNLEFVNCRYTKPDKLIEVLTHYIPKLPKPLAIILDSVFRLRHIMPIIKREFGTNSNIIEYSGFIKDTPTLDDNTILVGTSSIEVGINMAFKSLITEASYWTSAIQRIGRAGRFCKSDVIVLTTKNIAPYLQNKLCLSRDELENDILKAALKDIKMTRVCGDMFRGDSYPFLVYDMDSKRMSSYTESIFAMYEPCNWIYDWQSLDLSEKKDLLRGYDNLEENITNILLKDRLFPFWGIIEGRLRNRYEKIYVHADDEELTILCENSNMEYIFEKGHRINAWNR